MITLIVPHDGQDRIARHLTSSENDEVAIMTFGLIADDALGAVRELRLLATGARSKRPFIHVTASPSRDYTDSEWQAYWDIVEREFGLAGSAYLGARHRKLGAGGRTAGHAHRLYLGLTERQTGIDLSHSYARSEKVSRLAEFKVGERLTPGRHVRAVVNALEAEGHREVADAIKRMGQLDGRQMVATTPSERAHSDRRGGMAADEIAGRAWAAWKRSTDAGSFVSALADFGLRLAQGDAHVRVMDSTGVHLDLRRKLNQAARSEDGSKVLKADVEQRLKGLKLETLSSAIASFEPLRPAQQQLRTTGRVRLNRKRVSSPSRRPAETLSTPARHRAGGAAPRPENKKPAPAERIVHVEPNQFTLAEQASIIRFRRALMVGVPDEVRMLKERYERETAELAANDTWRLDKPTETEVVLNRTHDLQKPAPAEKRVDRRVLINLDHRRRVLAKDISSASIGRPGWRDAFKAELASVDAKFGPLLRWVERREAERAVYVLLVSGETIVETPDHVTVDVANPCTAALMVSYAVSQGWREIEIRGGNESWRSAILDAARAAGVTVFDSNPRPPDPLRAIDTHWAEQPAEPANATPTPM